MAMASKSLLLFLYLAKALAEPSTGSCLDPHALGAANKQVCCSGTGNGQATVGTALYEYTCNSFANHYYGGPLDASNAYQCAEKCTQDPKCHASSWQPKPGGSGGDCWLSSGAFSLTADQYQQWVILVNTKRAGPVVDPQPPAQDCDEEIKKAHDDCTSEKDDLTKKCTSEKDDLTKRCTSEKDDLTKRCTSEKDDLTKKCTSEKDDLTKKCTSEKNDMTKKWTSEKKNLTKELADCQNAKKPIQPDNQPSCAKGPMSSHGGKSFKSFCKSSMVGNTQRKLQVMTSTDPNKCLSLCARHPHCGWIHYQPTARACHLYPSTSHGQIRFVGGNYAWDIYQKL